MHSSTLTALPYESSWHSRQRVRLLRLYFVRVSYNPYTMSARCFRGLWCAMVLPLFLGRFERDGLQTTTLFVATSLYRSSRNTYKVGGF